MNILLRSIKNTLLLLRVRNRGGENLGPCACPCRITNNIWVREQGRHGDLPLRLHPYSERLPLLAVAWVLGIVLLVGCDTGGTPSEPASKAAIRTTSNPQGRILTANQGANSVTLIDVATDSAYGTVPTGEQPHHVAATPDGSEFWVTLYKENRLQVFDPQTLQEKASVDVGASNDDLTFDPAGKRVYVSLGAANAVAVVDVASKKLLKTVKVGTVPHGLKVTPDGKLLVVTNTADNTVSVLSLESEASVKATIKTGADPFEVTISDDGGTAYVSNFLGDSISVVDINAGKTVSTMKAGRQPAMLTLEDNGNGQKVLAVANTGSAELWILDPATRKLVTRIPVGQGAHGVVRTPNGKLYVTNSTDNTVTVIDAAQNKVVGTIPVANNPNGLAFLPVSR